MKNRRGPKDASRRYHDRVARKYDAMYDDEYWEFHDRITWEAIKPYLPRDASALLRSGVWDREMGFETD